MLVPLGTDRDGRRPANAVRLIILLNSLVYVAMFTGAVDWLCDPGLIEGKLAAMEESTGTSDLTLARAIVASDALDVTPGESPWWTWLTAMFVHSPESPIHLLGNMIFLWAFGKPIESHLGFWRFLGLYLAGGVVGWCGHWLLSPNPSIGASGATTSVAFLMMTFFPRGQVKVLSLLGLSIMVFPTPVLLLTYLAVDLIMLGSDRVGLATSDVAFGAHFAGAAFGVFAGLLCLRWKLAPRGEWDLLHLIRQGLRRRAMRQAFGQQAHNEPAPVRAARLAASGGHVGERLQSAERMHTETTLRATIVNGLQSANGDAVANALRTLLALDPPGSLAAATLLDAANLVLVRGDATLAASAYATFLKRYPADSKVPEIKLLLASLFTRRLHRRDEARPLLVGLLDRLHDPEQRNLVEALIAECAAPPTIASDGRRAP